MPRFEYERNLVAESGLFDVSFYLVEGTDVQGSGQDPTDHFCAFGWREGRRPNLYFDPAWYRDVYFGAADTETNPLVHYILGGEAAGYQPVCFFDPVWYKTTYALPREQSALRHYLVNRRSGRFSPNPRFDLAFYLARHGGDIGRNRDPFAHLLRLGADRDLDPSPDFQSAAYRRDIMDPEPDVAATLGAREQRIPFIHYLDRLARDGGVSRGDKSRLA